MSRTRNRWQDVPEDAQQDLLEWLNIRPGDVANEDRERLAALFHAGKFHAWDCPTCRDRVYWGDPDDWGHFQGVCQADFTSYPGSPDRFTARVISQQCDACRMDRPEYEAPDLCGIGEPSCWVGEE